MFRLNPTTRLMLVPTVGFGWVIGDHHVADVGTSECVLGIAATTDHGVEAIVERARNAGATVATEPAPQPWGYAASFADPDGHIWTVTSASSPADIVPRRGNAACKNVSSIAGTGSPRTP